MRLLIKNGRVVDPVDGTVTMADVLVEKGRITAVGDCGGIDAGSGSSAGDFCAEDGDGLRVYDASGKFVSPGFIDMHVHLREPGREDKETIRTGTRAAAMGGFTTIACMPNTTPAADNQAVIEFVKARARAEGIVKVLPVGAITKGLEGQEMAEMGDLVKSGAVAVSDDGKAVTSPRVMRHALEYAKIWGIPLLVHEEEPSLAEGDMNEGEMSTLLGLRGISRLAEELMVARDLVLAEELGGRLHICHVSTERSVELLRQAKSRGVRVTAEATPHHFTLTDEAVCSWDTSTKVNPPLRTEADRNAIILGLRDGTIDAVATDHAPHTREEKDTEYAVAPNGLVGLETAVPLAMTVLMAGGHMDMVTAVRRLTTGPARALGLTVPRIEKGAVADITVIDPELRLTVNPDSFESKGRNTPFAGMELEGWPVLTVVDGRIVMEDRIVVG